MAARIAAWTAAHGRGATDRVTVPLWVLTFATGVYGGYFGAAQGVLLMGIFSLFLAESLQRQNALKNVLAGLVNLVAAVVFILTTHVDWTAAVAIAVRLDPRAASSGPASDGDSRRWRSGRPSSSWAWSPSPASSPDRTAPTPWPAASLVPPVTTRPATES